MTARGTDDWKIFTGTGRPRKVTIPEPPRWRRFGGEPGNPDAELPEPPPEPDGESLAPVPDGTNTILMVNAALRLRRPLLVTGPPGAGKSTLARLVARELRLGRVLRWPITSSSRLQDGLYEYDAIGWVQEQNSSHAETRQRIGDFIRLGPLGTALLPWPKPRVLLIDEIDKADIDLPNDLLHVFEEGEFPIRELFRLPDGTRDRIEVFTADRAVTEERVTEIARRPVRHGVVRCTEFPLVLMTSNGERAFPPAFLRRCLRLALQRPDHDQLREIVRSRIDDPADAAEDVIRKFTEMVGDDKKVAVDQVLNAVFILTSGGERWSEEERQDLRALFLRELD